MTLHLAILLLGFGIGVVVGAAGLGLYLVWRVVRCLS